MPIAPRRPCLQPGCGALGNTPYCEKHTIQKKEEVRIKDRYRGSAASRGYTHEWNKFSKRYREQNPLCVMCEKEGKLVLAQCVDHIIPHKGDQKLFWDLNNLQSLCHSHHSEKTAREDNGYGNAAKERERFI